MHKVLGDGGLELTRRRAVDPLMAHVPEVTSRTTAVEYAQAAIEKLKGADFSHSVHGMADPCDVYGIECDGKGWWVKLTIETVEEPGKGEPKRRQVLVVSFHPPDRRFKTVNGKEFVPWDE